MSFYKFKKTSKDNSEIENTFFTKVIPILLIGLIIWMITTIIYGGTILFITITIPNYILLIITYFVLWILTFYFAYRKHNQIAMILFFTTAFITGIIQSPLILWSGILLNDLWLSIQLFLFASIMGVIATSMALIIGYKIGTKMSGFKNITTIILIYGIVIVGIEVILGIFYDWNSYILITSALVLIWIFASIIYEGSQLKNYEKDQYMWIVMSIFQNLIIVITRLFVILTKIFSKNKK